MLLFLLYSLSSWCPWDILYPWIHIVLLYGMVLGREINSDKNSLRLKGRKRAKTGGIGEGVREFNQFADLCDL